MWCVIISRCTNLALDELRSVRREHKITLLSLFLLQTIKLNRLVLIQLTEMDMHNYRGVAPGGTLSVPDFYKEGVKYFEVTFLLLIRLNI